MIGTIRRIRNLPREREIAAVFLRHGMGFVLKRYALGRALMFTTAFLLGLWRLVGLVRSEV